MAGGEPRTATLEFYRSNMDKRGWDVNMAFGRPIPDVVKDATAAERMAWAAWSAISLYTSRNANILSKYQPLDLDAPPAKKVMIANPVFSPPPPGTPPLVHETDKPMALVQFTDDGAGGVTVRELFADGCTDPRWLRLAERFATLFNDCTIKDIPEWVLPKLVAMGVCSNCGAKHDQFVYDSQRIEEGRRGLALGGVKLDVVRCRCLSCGNVAVTAREAEPEKVQT